MQGLRDAETSTGHGAGRRLLLNRLRAAVLQPISGKPGVPRLAAAVKARSRVGSKTVCFSEECSQRIRDVLQLQTIGGMNAKRSGAAPRQGEPGHVRYPWLLLDVGSAWMLFRRNSKSRGTRVQLGLNRAAHSGVGEAELRLLAAPRDHPIRDSPVSPK